MKQITFRKCLPSWVSMHPQQGSTLLHTHHYILHICSTLCTHHYTFHIWSTLYTHPITHFTFWTHFTHTPLHISHLEHTLHTPHYTFHIWNTLGTHRYTFHIWNTLGTHTITHFTFGTSPFQTKACTWHTDGLQLTLVSKCRCSHRNPSFAFTPSTYRQTAFPLGRGLPKMGVNSTEIQAFTPLQD